MEALKRGGRMKQKQKQSVVIKNVINIGKGERKKKAKRRAGTRRKQPQAMQPQPFIPAGQPFPLQRLFQPQQQVYRSVVMGSSTANEAVNNASPVVERTQQIQEGKVKAELENKLEKSTYKNLLDELDQVAPVSDAQKKRFYDLTKDEDEEMKIESPMKREMKYDDMPPLEASPIFNNSSSYMKKEEGEPDTILNPATGRWIKNTPQNRRKIKKYIKKREE